MTQRLRCHHAHSVIELLHLAPDLKQLCADRFQMFRDHIFHGNVTLGRRCRQHKGACLDLIRNNRILCRMQLLHSNNPDHVRTGAADIGSHAVQEVGNVNHMRLLRRILDNCLALCHGRRHHNIDGCPDRHLIQINVGAG